MREIVFDTETTGLSPEDGERIIEIGAVELENRFPTGRTFHAYINPQGRPIHPEAQAIHGISAADLVDKPTFGEIAESFLEFVSDAHLIAHNAGFDMAFVNAELRRLGVDAVPQERVVDTLALARRHHPMGPNSLDALCSRYGIDNSHRTKHGALLDSELLAEVYVELTGGRQAALVLEEHIEIVTRTSPETVVSRRRDRPAPLPPRITAEEIETHSRFVAGLSGNSIWADYGM